MRTTTDQIRTASAILSPLYFLWFTVVIGLILGQAAQARVSSFSVNPTRVTLSASVKSALVTLTNETDQPLRFQLSVMAWDQALDGEMKLTPTQDVVFFPVLVTLRGREARNVRVGVTAVAGSVEKTYRLFVEELPALELSASATGVAIVTKMGIPIFVQPTPIVSEAAIEELTVKSGNLYFRLQNKGNVSMMPRDIRVVGVDASGTTLVDLQPTGWYILARGARVFEVEWPAAQCAVVRSIAVEAQLAGATLKQTLLTPTGACAK